MKETYNILLKGVYVKSGFGFSCMKRAIELEIPGRLRYLDDKTIQIDAQGESNRIEEFFSWCLNSRETSDGTCHSGNLFQSFPNEFTIINSL